MKFFAASDIHGDKDLVSKLVKQSAKASLVVIAGDLTWAEADLSGIIGPFKAAGKKVIMIPGNHETDASVDFLQEMYKPGVYNLHGKSIIIEGVGFFGCGSSNIGLFQLTEDEVYDTLMKAFKKIKACKKKVLITHTPPYNTLVDNLGWISAGSKAVRDVIEMVQPDLCVCGHLHETEGLSDVIGRTRVINVGHKGKLLEI